MTAHVLPAGSAALLDLLDRLVLTHGLDPALVAAALGVSPSAVAGLAARGCAHPLASEADERLPLLVNVLLRLEHRAGHDSRSVRCALATPLAALGGAAPADLLSGGPDALRRVRAALDEVRPSGERWWRVGHH